MILSLFYVILNRSPECHCLPRATEMIIFSCFFTFFVFGVYQTQGEFVNRWLRASTYAQESTGSLAALPGAASTFCDIFGSQRKQQRVRVNPEQGTPAVRRRVLSATGMGEVGNGMSSAAEEQTAADDRLPSLISPRLHTAVCLVGASRTVSHFSLLAYATCSCLYIIRGNFRVARKISFR